MSRLIYRPIDGGIQLAIQTGDRPSLKDGCGVVELPAISELCESNNGRDRFTGEGCECGVESTGGDGELGGIFGVVRQASQDSLRTTEDFDARYFTPLDSHPDESESVH